MKASLQRVVGRRRRGASRVTRACASIAFACSSALAQQAPQNALAPAGEQARSIGDLWWLFYYVLWAVWALVVAAALFAVVKGMGRKAGSGETPDEPEVVPDPAYERRKTFAVGGALGLTVVILFVFLVSSFLTGRKVSSMSAGGSVFVEVRAHQWWWEVRYTDSTASNTFTTANEIHIPTGRPVQLKLTSTDVIHSFWVPNLSGKKDAIPGKETTLMLNADREGVFRGQCAEFCGHQHAHMAFLVIAESQEKFAAWQQRQRQPAAQPTDATLRRGQQVFMGSPCVMCHTITGTQAGSNVGPNLTHVGSRSTIAAATLANTTGHLSGWVSDAQGVKPGSRMPPNNLTPDDLQALVAYLQSLK
ncbi:MAG TPA: cytochrome c oxidase subunit II [Pyrinomonadaceae bacterium]|nr:cytochrome c oxidase subunit II [Pyrinomonadaceae bacterium]